MKGDGEEGTRDGERCWTSEKQRMHRSEGGGRAEEGRALIASRSREGVVAQGTRRGASGESGASPRWPLPAYLCIDAEHLHQKCLLGHALQQFWARRESRPYSCPWTAACTLEIAQSRPAFIHNLGPTAAKPIASTVRFLHTRRALSLLCPTFPLRFPSCHR